MELLTGVASLSSPKSVLGKGTERVKLWGLRKKKWAHLYRSIVYYCWQQANKKKVTSKRAFWHTQEIWNKKFALSAERYTNPYKAYGIQ